MDSQDDIAYSEASEHESGEDSGSEESQLPYKKPKVDLKKKGRKAGSSTWSVHEKTLLLESVQPRYERLCKMSKKTSIWREISQEIKDGVLTGMIRLVLSGGEHC
jgi:hypothetical protein